MSERESHIAVVTGSERSFGIVFTLVIAIVGLWPLSQGETLGTLSPVRTGALFVAGLLLIVTLFAPHLLKTPNRLWFRFGMLLGAIVAPFVMALVYVTTLTPTGVIMRLMGKDPMARKLDPDAPTYWIKRKEKPGPMKHLI